MLDFLIGTGFLLSLSLPIVSLVYQSRKGYDLSGDPKRVFLSYLFVVLYVSVIGILFTGYGRPGIEEKLPVLLLPVVFVSLALRDFYRSSDGKKVFRLMIHWPGLAISVLMIGYILAGFISLI